jgi:hypothetical protein
MAPEQARGSKVDGRCDLFSLGVVLYEMSTGQRPFQGADFLALMAALANDQPVPPQQLRPDLPGALARLIGCLLAKQPEGRSASAREVADALRAIEGGKAGDATTSLLERPGANPATVVMPAKGETGARRRRVALLLGLTLAGLLVVLGGLGAALGWWNFRAAKEPLSAELGVGIWKKRAPSRRLSLEDEGALPLRAGDWMRIEAKVNRPAYLYVIYLDARGEASPMYPWRKYKWGDRPAEEKRTVLHLPEDPRKDASPLEVGPSGIESVLLLARDEPLSAAENERLAELLGKAPRQTEFDPLRGAVRLGGDEEQFSVRADRGRPALDKAGEVADPVERLRRMLRAEVGTLAPVRRGVCYPFAGR